MPIAECGANVEMAWARWLAAFAIDTEKISDAERPPASVAVTLMLNGDALVGTVPVNVSVAPLKCSHVGKAAPFASVAV